MHNHITQQPKAFTEQGGKLTLNTFLRCFACCYFRRPTMHRRKVMTTGAERPKNTTFHKKAAPKTGPGNAPRLGGRFGKRRVRQNLQHNFLAMVIFRVRKNKFLSTLLSGS